MNSNKPSNESGKAVVAESEDAKTSQDFPGFPHAHSNEKLINPKTEEQQKTAAVPIKDGEKLNKDEQKSDGSGGAFEATESVGNDE